MEIAGWVRCGVLGLEGNSVMRQMAGPLPSSSLSSFPGRCVFRPSNSHPYIVDIRLPEGRRNGKMLSLAGKAALGDIRI